MVALSSQVWSDSGCDALLGPIQKSMWRFLPTWQPLGGLGSSVSSAESLQAYSSPHSRHESSKMKYCWTSGL